jgi:hypothetical protein
MSARACLKRRTRPRPPGAAIVLTPDAHANDDFVSESWFSPSGDTLYHRYGADQYAHWHARD